MKCYEVHEGQDYTVVLAPGETTDDATAHFTEADKARKFVHAMNLYAEMLKALKRARFVMESPLIAHLVNGAGTLDLVRETIAKAEGRS
jgi:hypothetical protein